MDSAKTIRERIQGQFDGLTRAERQLANSLLENYPVSGLSSITAVAHNADVSTPTVARMVQKLGFRGFPHFQESLRGELSAKISNPIEKHDRWAQNVPDSHILNRFTEAVIQNLRQTLDQIEPEIFDEVCALLADQERSIYLVGGRITRSLAEYLFTHLQIVRPNVRHLHSNSGAWTHYVLDMKPDDVLVVFDMRRYENDLLKLSEMATERQVEIVLFTDQWGSPVSKLARHRFNSRIEVPSAWDSASVTLLLLEAIIAEVQERDWSITKDRLETLENLFNQTRLFRKFI
jgi:DNA-binding MurR/RpiR family transcriptional regulator